MSQRKDSARNRPTEPAAEELAAGPRERTIAHLRQILARSGVAGAALGIVTCESGTVVCDPLPSPSPPGAACLRTVVRADSGALSAQTLVSASFRTEAPGVLEVIVDWTFSSSAIGVYVVSGECSLDQFAARTCDFLVRSDPSSIKPRRVTSDTIVQPGVYSLLLANFSAESESVSFQVVLAQGGCEPGAERRTSAPSTATLGELNRLVPFTAASGQASDPP